MSHKSIITAALLFTTTAFAQVQFGGLSHRGSGCPVGSVGISPSPDGSSVSILFDSFQVQVPRNIPSNGRINRANDPALDYKTCALSLTANLTDGQKIESLEISVFNRGAIVLDPAVRATLSTVFMGSEGLGGTASKTILENRTWLGEANEDWISNPIVRIPINSTCASGGARSVRFMLNSQMELAITDRNLNHSGLATVDSSDVNGTVKIRVITSSCGGRTAPLRVRRFP